VFARIDRDAIASFIDVLEHARTSGGQSSFAQRRFGGDREPLPERPHRWRTNPMRS